MVAFVVEVSWPSAASGLSFAFLYKTYTDSLRSWQYCVPLESNIAFVLSL